MASHRGGGHDSHYLEGENDQLTTQLRSKVKSLKSLTIDIGEEVRSQNRMIGDMDDDFSRSGSILDRSLKRLGSLGKGLHNYHTAILFLFVFVAFFLLWIGLKFR